MIVRALSLKGKIILDFAFKIADIEDFLPVIIKSKYKNSCPRFLQDRLLAHSKRPRVPRVKFIRKTFPRQPYWCYLEVKMFTKEPAAVWLMLHDSKIPNIKILNSLKALFLQR